MKIRIFLTGLIVLVLVVLVRGCTIPSRQLDGLDVENVAVPDAAIDRLSAAIRIKTISHQSREQFDSAEFQKLHELLRTSYPYVARTTAREVVNEHSLLYHWAGSDRNRLPYLMLAHLDVVPIEPGTEEQWRYPPFSGAQADDAVWGRGAIDDKANVMAIMEAAELLAASGFTPTRSIYFGFGHDEEINGEEGALKIAQLLQSREVTLEFVSDEGLFILTGSMPGISAPIAYIGIAEKGYLDLELAVKSQPGHSSMPPHEAAVTKLSRAIAALSDTPFPSRIDGAVREMFDFVAPEMNFPLKLLFANRWLLNPLIKWQLASDPTTNAMIRTTYAPTMLQGSIKPNVLPARPSAIVNIRILPGESVDSVVARTIRIIDDPEVSVTPQPGANDPLAPSTVSSPEFSTLHRLIRGLYPNVLVAPALMIGGTDSKHFKNVTKNIYRFSPMEMSDEDLSTFHGTNEKIGVENYRRMVIYYYNLIKRLDEAG